MMSLSSTRSKKVKLKSPGNPKRSTAAVSVHTYYACVRHTSDAELFEAFKDIAANDNLVRVNCHFGALEYFY